MLWNAISSVLRGKNLSKMFNKSIVIFKLISICVTRYHFQLSVLCLVSFYEYHKNSFENFRTDVKIGIFPIPIELWSGFGFSSKIGRIPTRSGCLDSLHRHTTFMASFTCLRLTRLNEFRCRFLLTSFKFSIVFFFNYCWSCFKRSK